ncbi:MAG: DNA gyrase subunit A [Bacilli bacterium]|jgi:DNA gyrase subunit A|nr:DNA gyrase subunit A [Bacillota bacterium]OQC50340.1 MAG: DNA gyrase subunit A [Tenericutes bacterium ADurb.Bin024]HOE53700.1 DNA gyrase subunit A [Bacilli bacterium]HOM32126.1 DNA gyrase subunit A [Bacilli bacterium]HPK28387.1 DNA gyrase subunit A [Bacilli bacterium]
MVEDNIKDMLEEEEKHELEGIDTGIHPVDVVDEVRKSFLDYAMSVIVSRAIPDVRDGFKPVHRRIVYGMYESGMTPDKPFKKSARIVGDVMGKYHPHGDQAIYSTLVRMAQPFSLRYPLVDGHGNFGSIDGDEAAAMRYTEARMEKLATEMVRDINLNTVDFGGNYDGSEKEPEVLPSRFPNLIVNGSDGIAVGMATYMVPHNLSETIDAINLVAKNPDVTPREIFENGMLGPDFPTGASILGRKGILDYFETGEGSIIVRAKTHFETKGDRTWIVIDEMPYKLNKATTIEAIALLVRNKEIDGITDIRDESNKEGIRVVIELRRDVVPEVVLNNLLKQTRLQTSYKITNLCLVNKAPRILNMKELIVEYLNFQVEIIRRRTEHQLSQAEARDHIVEGLLKATDNIDEIVSIIKNSESGEEASQKLMERFLFSEIQTREVLGMTLRRLTGLEIDKLNKEREQLLANIERYRLILSARDHMVDVVLEELEEIKAKYGDERRTEISDDLADIDNEDLIPVEDIVVMLTNQGYIKRVDPEEFRTIKRGGVGVKGMRTKEEEIIDIILHTNTHTDVLFFTSKGKVYRKRGYQIPQYRREGKGLPVINLLNIEKEEAVRAIVSTDTYGEDHYLLYVTRNGVTKRTTLAEFSRINVSGKIAIDLREGDELMDVKITDGTAIIGIGSSNGKMASFYETDVRAMGRTAAGVRGIKLDEGAYVVGVTTSLEGALIFALTTKGYGKLTPANDYRLTKRGSKGVITIKESERTGTLAGIRAIKGDEDLFVTTASGMVVRTNFKEISTTSRNTMGVRVIRLRPDDVVCSFAVVEKGIAFDEDDHEGEGTPSHEE